MTKRILKPKVSVKYDRKYSSTGRALFDLYVDGIKTQIWISKDDDGRIRLSWALGMVEREIRSAKK